MKRKKEVWGGVGNKSLKKDSKESLAFLLNILILFVLVFVGSNYISKENVL